MSVLLHLIYKPVKSSLSGFTTLSTAAQKTRTTEPESVMMDVQLIMLAAVKSHSRYCINKKEETAEEIKRPAAESVWAVKVEML